MENKRTSQIQINNRCYIPTMIQRHCATYRRKILSFSLLRSAYIFFSVLIYCRRTCVNFQIIDLSARQTTKSSNLSYKQDFIASLHVYPNKNIQLTVYNKDRKFVVCHHLNIKLGNIYLIIVYLICLYHFLCFQKLIWRKLANLRTQSIHI